MKVLERLKRVLLYDCTIDDPAWKIRTQIWKDNRKFAVIWAIAELIYWGFCIFMSFREERFYLCRPVYIAALIAAALALLCAVFLAPKKKFLLHASKILVDVSLIGGGLLIAWILLPHNQNTVTIFASVLIAPTLFVNNTLSNIVMVALDIIAAIILMQHGLSPDVYVGCLTDLVIFSTMGITLAHFINKARFERYEFSESVAQLAESNAKLAELQTRYAYYDQMTGLQNRRAYSERIAALFEDMPPYCCIVMADINGLKETNDTLGHDAGDELIIGAAECLRSGFQGIDDIYRLGGDEFCVILTDEAVDVPACLQRAEEACAGWHGTFVHGISIAHGFATTAETADINDVSGTADRRMYVNKSNYYISVGKNGR